MMLLDIHIMLLKNRRSLPKLARNYAKDQYRMYHDIYSLGVVLLEVGLWSSFVEYPETLGVRIAVLCNCLAELPAGEDKDPRGRVFKKNKY